MDISLVDSYVLEVLSNNGWYVGRKFDVSIWIEKLSNEGYIVFDYATKILEELNGIEINIGNNQGYKGAIFDFNFFDAASGEFDRVERLKAIINEKLYPIGQVGQAFDI